jgi:Flp pilus assembly protein TadD
LAAAGTDDAEADALLRRANAIDPSRRDTYVELARLYLRQGRGDDSLAVYQRLLERDPRHLAALHGVATHHARRGDLAAAIPLWERAAAIAPDDADVQQSLGIALIQSDRVAEGVKHLRAAVAADANRVEACSWLAWVLATAPTATTSDANDALDLGRRAVERSGGGSLRALDALGAAQARAGRFDDALRTVQRAMDIASARGESDVVRQLSERKTLYESRKPYVRSP